MSVIHHVHRRKRGARNLEPFPSARMSVQLLDHIAIAAGIIGPIMTLPQVYQIFALQNAAGVSAVSWGAFAILDIPFILYGVVHRDRLIIVTYILWIVMNTAVAAGAIIYN